MSEILEALKTDTDEPFWIADHERVTLIEILVSVSAMLRKGKIWFNKEGPEHNECYAFLCQELAKRFANMPVEKEQ